MEDSYNSELVQYISENPKEVQWHNPREISLEKLQDGRLSIVLFPQSIPGSSETLTIISRVHHDCKYTPEGSIESGVRVTEIDGHLITHLEFEDVTKILNDSKSRKNCISLSVWSPRKPQEVSDNRRSPNPAISDINESLKEPVVTPAMAADINTLSPADDCTAVSGDSIDLAQEAIKHPGKIRWSDQTDKIVVTKGRRKEKIGLHYTMRKVRSEVYCLVEEIDQSSPSEHKLHIGDLILSVNGHALGGQDWKTGKTASNMEEDSSCIHLPPKVKTILQRFRGCWCPSNDPVTSTLEVLKQEVNKSRTTVEFVIQRPKDVRQVWLPRIHMTRNDKKIDGRSVYSISADTMSMAGSIAGRSRSYGERIRRHRNQKIAATIPTGRKQLTEPSRSVSSLMHCDLNSLQHVVETEIERWMIPPSEIDEGGNMEFPEMQADVEPTVEVADEINSRTILSRCLDCLLYLAEEDIKHIPYTTVNVIGITDSEFHHDVLSKLKAELKAGTSMTQGSVYQMGKNSMEKSCSLGGTAQFTVEDLILAKHLTKNLKGSNSDAFIDRMKQLLQEEECDVHGIPNKLIRMFLDNPPPLDKDYLEIQFKIFNYDELLQLWPTVYFTMSAIYTIVLDLDSLAANQTREIEKLQTCLNLIHTSSSKTKIYIVCKGKTSTNLETVIPHFRVLDRELKNQKQFCMPCSCTQENLYGDVFSQIQMNKNTKHIGFSGDRKEDWAAFVSDLKSQFCNVFRGEHRFPFVAVMVMKLIKELELNGMATITRSRLTETVLDKALPDASEETKSKILAALHHCGKVCCPSQVPHRTVHNSAHNQFILLKPDALQKCAHHIANSNQPHLYSGLMLTQEQIVRDIMRGLSFTDKDEIFMFLQVYHIFEEGREHAGYLYSPHYMTHKPAILQQNVMEVMKNNFRHVLYVDFHGLLPLAMCLSLLQRLGEVMGDAATILSACTAVFMYRGIQILVHLLPYQARAVVLVSPSQQLSFHELHSFLVSVLFYAVESNLLTYHIGDKCLECVKGCPGNQVKDDPIRLGAIAHILDYKAAQVSNLSPNLSFLPGGWNTHLEQLPKQLLDVLYQGLDILDEQTGTAGWKILYECLHLQEPVLLRQLASCNSPARAFVKYLANRPEMTIAVLLENIRGSTSYPRVISKFCQMGVIQSNLYASSI